MSENTVSASVHLEREDGTPIAAAHVIRGKVLPDGSIDPSVIDKMLAEVKSKLGESAEGPALEKLAEFLKMAGAKAVVDQSVVSRVNRHLGEMEGKLRVLLDDIKGLAQSTPTNRPQAIFEYGTAHADLSTAAMLLGTARETLDHAVCTAANDETPTETPTAETTETSA